MKKIDVTNFTEYSFEEMNIEYLFKEFIIEKYKKDNDKRFFIDSNFAIESIEKFKLLFSDDDRKAKKVRLKNKKKPYYKKFIPLNHENFEEKLAILGWQLVSKSISPFGNKKSSLVGFSAVNYEHNIAIISSIEHGHQLDASFSSIGSIEGWTKLGNKEDVLRKIYDLIKESCVPNYRQYNPPPKGARYYVIGMGAYGLELFNLQKVACTIEPNMIEKSYPNIDDDKIRNFFTATDSGKLLLIHGKPGSGKTTYIRHMLSEYYKGTVVILNAEMLKNITNANFAPFAIQNLQGTVVLIEDAETILVARGEDHEGRTSVISDLLNFTDGILGDALNIRFIATFNTKVEEIDQAFLRKGRLYHREEINGLNKEQAIEFLKIKEPTKAFELTKEDYTLADLYSLLSE